MVMLQISPKGVQGSGLVVGAQWFLECDGTQKRLPRTTNVVKNPQLQGFKCLWKSGTQLHQVERVSKVVACRGRVWNEESRDQVVESDLMRWYALNALVHLFFSCKCNEVQGHWWIERRLVC